MRIIIPVVPIAKGRPRLTTRGGFARAYTPQKTRDAEEEIRLHIRSQYKDEPLKCPIGVRMWFYMPAPKSTPKSLRNVVVACDAMLGTASKVAHPHHSKKPDLDNLIKTVADSANGILWEDDSQICDMAASKCLSFSPQIIIEIYPYDDSTSR